MLLKLEENQIAHYWKVIEQCIRESLPPNAFEEEGTLNNIYKNLLSGAMQCWVLYKNKVISCLFVTTIQKEIGGSKSLLIYSLYGYENMTLKDWKEGFEILRRFAKGQNCKKVIAFTEVQRVVQIVKSLGGEARFTFVTIPVEGEDENL